MLEYASTTNRSTPAQRAAAAKQYLSAVPKHQRAGLSVRFHNGDTLSPIIITKTGGLFFDARVSRVRAKSKATRKQAAEARIAELKRAAVRAAFGG